MRHFLSQLSKWTNFAGYGYPAINTSIVHADSMAFVLTGLTKPNMVVEDGGVGYSSNLASTNTNNFIIQAGMVTTQFYSVREWTGFFW